jgi:hypothetical protein
MMPRRIYKPEEIIAKLRQVEVLTSQGKSAVSDLTLEKLVLKEAASGIYGPPPGCKVFQVLWAKTVCVNLSGLFVRQFITSGHDGHPRPTGTS